MVVVALGVIGPAVAQEAPPPSAGEGSDTAERGADVAALEELYRRDHDAKLLLEMARLYDAYDAVQATRTYGRYLAEIGYRGPIEAAIASLRAASTTGVRTATPVGGVDFEAERVEVQIERPSVGGDPGVWSFRRGGAALPENVFVRSYAKLTGAADLNRVLRMRSVAPMGIAGATTVAGIAALVVGAALPPDARTSVVSRADDGTPTAVWVDYSWSAGSRALFGLGAIVALISQGAFLTAAAFTDGTARRHTLTEAEARDGVARYNTALLVALGRAQPEGQRVAFLPDPPAVNRGRDVVLLLRRGIARLDDDLPAARTFFDEAQRTAGSHLHLRIYALFALAHADRLAGTDPGRHRRAAVRLLSDLEEDPAVVAWLWRALSEGLGDDVDAAEIGVSGLARPPRRSRSWITPLVIAAVFTVAGAIVAGVLVPLFSLGNAIAVVQAGGGPPPAAPPAGITLFRF